MYSWDASKITDAAYREKFVKLPAIILDWLSENGGLAGKDILDFGCGEATTALDILLQHKAKRVVGIEIMPKLDLCTKFAEQQIGLRELPPI